MWIRSRFSRFICAFTACGFSFVLLVGFGTASFAQITKQKPDQTRVNPEPPPIVEFPQATKATVPRQIVSRLEVSGQRVVLEETELTAMQKRFGGAIGHRGDAGDALSWLCFCGSDDKGDWVLWLMSSEIDGGRVGGFRWQRVDRMAQLASCPRLSGGKAGVDLPISLRLGMSTSDALLILGKPSERLGQQLFYLHEHERKIHDQPFTAMNTLFIQIREGVVWAIEVWKSTTS